MTRPNRPLTRRPIRFIAATIPLLLGAGCSRGQPSSTTERTQSTAQAVISDQFHSGGSNGFVWLPPMVPAPPNLGGLLADVPVTVRVDETNPDGSTLRTLATFTRKSGPEGARIRFYPGGVADHDDDDGDCDEEGYYLARWDTDDFHLSTAANYRAHVLVPAKGGGQRELGFADVAVVRTEKQFKSVDTADFTPLVNGRDLRIKFRVDQPAVDQDGDGVFDWVDDCPTVYDPDQKDSLHNGVGDACRCLPVTCTAQDSCHVAGACQPATGTCTNPIAADGTACPITNASAACSAGSCELVACNAGFADCNGSLADGCETPTTTIANCGACANACSGGANAAAVCAGGQCGLSCSAGWADCDGLAADGCEQNVATDAANCGACGRACASHEACVSGACTTAACQPGYGDCNHDATDGCESTLASDASNCGACGVVCAAPNATPACNAGACGIAACNAGFADCNGLAADGCEIDIAADVSNCGVCGAACQVPNGTPACNAGACGIAACNAGFADCDQNPADGCEIDVATDVNNCGACGAACQVPNATPACTGGACGIAACNAGFADCDGNPANGCEASLGTDTSNCGACGNACPSGPSSTATCNGACGLACDPGFADCDGNPATGCEVSLGADANNCGACGNACPAQQSCQNGACAAVGCPSPMASCNGTTCGVDTSADPNNCGVCGNVCAFANATPQCTGGACGFSVCDPGFGDCDGNPANGCEATLGSDPNNCGACGNVCASGQCNAGVCASSQICNGGGSACTGLCQQQTTCSGGVTTSVTGRVYAPNGVDPLPNVLVYVPNAPVQPFAPGVACGTCGADVSGSPLVSTDTAFDGTFTLTNVPVGANIPLVIQTGRWRRQFTIPSVLPCATTQLGPQVLRMPRTKAEGDIPLMAFVTGNADALECVLRKVGIADTEFSNPAAQGGTGRVRVYKGEGGPGAEINPITPSAIQLWTAPGEIEQYDQVYFACQGSQYTKTPAQQAVVRNYANAGGRVFATHFSYVWLDTDPVFAGTARWSVAQPSPTPDPQTGYINPTFPRGADLAQWLQVVGASTVFGQIPIGTLRHDFNGVLPPSQLWVSLGAPNNPPGTAPMHYTFDTPVGAPPTSQCGRVLFSDFHVETASVTPGTIFPAECTTGPMSPQEKMLEFMIFDLGSCVAPPTCN